MKLFDIIIITINNLNLNVVFRKKSIRKKKGMYGLGKK